MFHSTNLSYRCEHDYYIELHIVFGGKCFNAVVYAEECTHNCDMLSE